MKKYRTFRETSRLNRGWLKNAMAWINAKCALDFHPLLFVVLVENLCGGMLLLPYTCTWRGNAVQVAEGIAGGQSQV